MKLFLVMLLFIFTTVFGMSEGESTALRKLTASIEVLTSYEDELVDEPITGTLIMQDTVSIDMSLSSAYIYEIVVWTESSFNFVDFWVTKPSGAVPLSEQSDHISFSARHYSAESQIWNLQIELLEGANSDSAYYAFALLRRDK